MLHVLQISVLRICREVNLISLFCAYLTSNVTWRKSQPMISGKLLADQLNKFLKSPVCQSARVQVKLPQGEFHSPDGYFDIISMSLLENNVIGSRESHRIVLEISTTESWRMGKVKKKI